MLHCISLCRLEPSPCHNADVIKHRYNTPYYFRLSRCLVDTVPVYFRLEPSPCHNADVLKHIYCTIILIISDNPHVCWMLYLYIVD